MAHSDGPPAAELTGWRYQLHVRADLLRSVPLAGSADRSAVDRAYSAVETATQPRGSDQGRAKPSLGDTFRRIRDWLTAGEARRYEAALAAVLALRGEILVNAQPEAVAAHVPELREEMKRLVPTNHPAFDPYLRLLDRIESGIESGAAP